MYSSSASVAGPGMSPAAIMLLSSVETSPLEKLAGGEAGEPPTAVDTTMLDCKNPDPTPRYWAREFM